MANALLALKTKTWGRHPRGTKLLCQKCKRRKDLCQFKRVDNPDRFCNPCRWARERAEGVVEPDALDAGEIKLGSERVLRITVIGGVVTFVTGKIVTRNTSEHEMAGGAENYAWQVVNANPTFQADCSTLTVPLRLLEKLRAALAQIARDNPRSVLI